MMNRIVLLIVTFSLAINANSQWTQVFTNNSTYDDLVSMSATKDGGVIAVRKVDYIKSSDFGSNWTLSTLPCHSNWDLRTVGMFNKDTFCISGGYSSSSWLGLYVSFNGGAGFNCYNYTTLGGNQGTNKVYISKSGVIFVATFQGKLFYSPDFGQSYTEVYHFTNGFPVAASFINDSIGVIAQQLSISYYNYSLNQMINLSIPYGNVINDAQMVSDSTIYFVANNANLGGKNVFKTADAGQTWQKLFLTELNGINDIKKINFINKDTGFVYGDKILLRTTNGGNTWQVKRFSGSLLVQQVAFTNLDTGFIAGKESSASYIYKTTTGGGPWIDFNYWYLGTTSCCENILCNIFNSSTSSSNFTWLLDGIQIATGVTPAPMVLTSGNHVLSLITDDGIEIDTFTQNIYSAPPLPSNTTITGNGDTSLCYGSVFGFGASSSNPNYYYSLWEGTTIMDYPNTGNGFTIPLYSFPLYDTTIITIKLESRYPHCPGNIVTRDIDVLVFPNTASDDPYFIEDSVCRGSTAQFVIPNSNSSYNYFVKADGCGNYNQSASGGNPIIKNININPINGCSDWYYYSVADSYGCSYNSENIFLLVDSVNARLYSNKMYGYVGDVLNFNNPSEGTNYVFDYDTNYLQLLNSNWSNSSFLITASGNSVLNYYVSNETGCIDSCFQVVHGYDPMYGYDNFCQETNSAEDPMTVFSEIGFRTFNNYEKVLHADKYGYTYLAGLSKQENNTVWDVSDIIKMDPSGNVVWRREIDLPGTSFSRFFFINSLATDTLQNIFITGRYFGNSFSVDGINLPNATVELPFVAKISSAGIFQWFLIPNLMCGGNTSVLTSLKVLNENRIMVQVNDVQCYSKIGSGLLVNYSPPSGTNGFIIIDGDGQFKKRINITNSFREYCNFDLNLSGGMSFPYGMEYEVRGDKIYVLSFIRYQTSQIFNLVTYFNSFSGSTSLESAAIVSIYDTNAINHGSFEAFRFTEKPHPVDYTNPLYNSSCDPDINSTRPRLTVDSKSNIYITCTPFSYANYDLYIRNDSISQSYCGYIIPGLGYIEGSYRSTLIAKYDSLGNNIYRLMNNGIVVKDFCISANDELNLIADYPRFYSLESTDGTVKGNTYVSDAINGVFFTYDKNGVIKNVQNIESDGNVTTAGIASIDTCNSNVYFTFVASDTTNYYGYYQYDDYKYYVVKVNNNNNNCSDSAACPWYVGSQVINSMNDKQITSDFHLVPNPANEFITLINQNFSSPITIKIFNSIGQKVFESNKMNTEQHQINVSYFQNGVYYLCLFDENGNFIEKLNFVKQ